MENVEFKVGDIVKYCRPNGYKFKTPRDKNGYILRFTDTGTPIVKYFDSYLQDENGWATAASNMKLIARLKVK